MKNNNNWEVVPEYWEETYCPTLESQDYVEVIFRDYSTNVGRAGSWELCWVQENTPEDIVRYRKIKATMPDLGGTAKDLEF